MKRRSVALFLSTLALAGGTAACGPTPEAGEKGNDHGNTPQHQSPGHAPADSTTAEGGEGGEG